MSINITLKQAEAIVDSFGGDGGPEDDPIVHVIAVTTGHSGPGLYLWSKDYPDEGSDFLGEEIP